MNLTFLLEKILTKLRALVFDLDDTLYPERSYIISGFKAVASWISGRTGLSSETAEKELLTLHDKGERTRTFDRWLEIRALPQADYLNEMIQTYRQHPPRIVAYPGAEPLLSRLRASHRLGLVSDGYQEVQRLKLDSLGLSNYLEAVVYSDAFGRKDWKPSTKPFEAVLSMLGVSPSEAAYIADNPLKDFLGAREIGMTTIRVRHRGGYYADCEPPTPSHAPDHQIKDILELEALLHGE